MNNFMKCLAFVPVTVAYELVPKELSLDEYMWMCICALFFVQQSVVGVIYGLFSIFYFYL